MALSMKKWCLKALLEGFNASCESDWNSACTSRSENTIHLLIRFFPLSNYLSWLWVTLKLISHNSLVIIVIAELIKTTKDETQKIIIFKVVSHLNIYMHNYKCGGCMPTLTFWAGLAQSIFKFTWQSITANLWVMPKDANKLVTW